MTTWMARLLWVVTIFTLGLFAGQYVDLFSKEPRSFSIDVGEKTSKYSFINPLLFCSDQEISNYTNALPTALENKLNDYIKSQTSKGALDEASVYYKDLNGGPWVLTNSKMKTVPASLLKVPTAMAIYKHAEKDPGILTAQKTLSSENIENKLQYFQPREMIEPGKSYSVAELIRYMLEDSDNAALYILGNTLPEKEFEESYSDLGIDVPTEVAPGYVIDAKTYASFFRVLFNASYLSRDTSEEMLTTLSHSGFSQGIRTGVPKGVVVADKFGEFMVNNTDLRLNDCGIVYRKHDPYILCVITRGTNFDSLTKIIAQISTIVWETLETQK
ncbi:MAG: serine hydrolase [Patescibacteria group bacterium]